MLVSDFFTTLTLSHTHLPLQLLGVKRTCIVEMQVPVRKIVRGARQFSRPECEQPLPERPGKMPHVTPIIPPDRPDEAVLRYVRELAKRLAREDHEAEIATRQASNL